MSVDVHTRGMEAIENIDTKKQRNANPSRINGHLKVTTVKGGEKIPHNGKPQIAKKPTLAPKPKFIKRSNSAKEKKEYFTTNQPRKVNEIKTINGQINYSIEKLNTENSNLSSRGKDGFKVPVNDNQAHFDKQKNSRGKQSNTCGDCKDLVRNGEKSNNSKENLSSNLPTVNCCTNKTEPSGREKNQSNNLKSAARCAETFDEGFNHAELNLTITNKVNETLNKNDSGDTRLQSTQDMTSQLSNGTKEAVSDIRKRFENMKIKFRKPSESDTVPTSPMSSLSPISPRDHANDLFKDIWSMKSEDLLDSLPPEQNNYQLASDNVWVKQSSLKTSNEKITDLNSSNAKFELEFKSSISSSMISPIDRKPFSKPQIAKKPDLSNRSTNNFNTRKTQSLPRKFKGAYLKQFDQDFDELPPPPTPPPTPNVSKKDLQSLNNPLFPCEKSLLTSAPKKSTSSGESVLKYVTDVNPLNGAPSQVNKQESYNLSEKSGGSAKRYLDNYQQSVTADCSHGTPQANAVKPNSADTDTFDGEALYYDNMLVMKQQQNKQPPSILHNKDLSIDRERQQKNSKSEASGFYASNDSKSSKTPDVAKQEFHSALDDLEKEFMKLSDSIEVSNSRNVNANNNNIATPPKLPPKKRQIQNENQSKVNNIVKSVDRNVPKPVMSNPAMDVEIMDTKTSIQMKMSHLEQQQLLLQQLQERKKKLLQQQQQLQTTKSAEDNRCSIIDEPLSTIEEEESNFGESCASSVIDEDDKLFMSCASSQSTLNATDTDPDQSQLSDEETEVDVLDKQPEGAESSSDEIDHRSDFRKSMFIEEEQSDVESIEWTESPIQNNRIPRSVTDKEGYERDIAELTGAGKSWEEITKTSPKIEQKSILPITRTPSSSSSNASSDHMIVTTGESENSSNNSTKSEIKKTIKEEEPTIEYNDEVTPYGVFDLTKLENPAPEKQKMIMSELGMNTIQPPRLPSQPPNFSPMSPVFPMMRPKKEEVVLPGYDNLEDYNVEVPKKEQRPKSGIGKHSTAVSALDRHEASLSARVKPSNEPKSLDPPHKQISNYERQSSNGSMKSTQQQYNENKSNRGTKTGQFQSVNSDSTLQSRELPAKPNPSRSNDLKPNGSPDPSIKYTPVTKKNAVQGESMNNKKNRFSNHYEELSNYSKTKKDEEKSPSAINGNKYQYTNQNDKELNVQDIMANMLPSKSHLHSHVCDKSFPVESEDIIRTAVSPPKIFNRQISSDSSRSNTLPRRSSNSNRPQHDAYFNVGHDEEAFESASNLQYDADTDGAVDANNRDQTSQGDLSSDDESFVYPNRPRSNNSNIDNKNKVLSPSMRKKRSLLERSKSPSKHSSRRSKSPSLFSKSKSRGDDSDKASSNNESLRKESRVKKFRRSLRRRSIKSGDESNKDEKSDDLKSDVSSPPPVPARIAMRRSKSQDRETATKEYRKHKKNLRSKSVERPQNSDYEDDGALSSGSKRSSGFFSRGSKRFSRGRSSERRKSLEDQKRSHSRGRNPVSFIRKLLRRNKSTVEGDPNIIRIPDSPGDSFSKNDADSFSKESRKKEQRERRNWTPPRSSTGQSKPVAAPRMRSPLSHRAKKMQRNKPLDTGSSSETSNIDRTRVDGGDHYENLGNKRMGLRPPNKPPRGHSRDNSFSNSAASSDSDAGHTKRPQISESDETSDGGMHRKRISNQRSSGKNKKSSRPLRPYSGHSKGFSDQESSTDVDGKSEFALKSSLKKGPVTRSKVGTLTSPPRRPVRIVSPRLSRSDPSLFPPNELPIPEDNAYYNVFEKSCTEEAKPPALPYKRRSTSKVSEKIFPSQKDEVGALATQQRQKYRTLVSLNSQTLKKVSEKWLSEWRNGLPVGGFLVTSWSDVTITSKRPLCMIGNSVIYPAHFTSNPEHKVACQLFDQNSVSSRFLRQLENCSTLTANPNICGVCSHFICRIPRQMLDPSSRSGMVDAVCVVLYSRPVTSLTDYLQQFVNSSGDVTDMHRQLLLVLIQLLKGLDHLAGSGFSVSNVTLEHLVISQERGLLQILPHLEWRGDNRDSDSSSDNSSKSNTTTTYQVIHLIKKILKRSFYANNMNNKYTGRNKTLPIVPGSPYSIALQTILTCLESPGLKPDNNSIISIAQCALWGPRELDDIDFDDVQPFSSLELWIDMEQAKLVNSLAVLPSGKNEPMKPSVFLKYQYFSQVNPQSLFQCLKTLERI